MAHGSVDDTCLSLLSSSINRNDINTLALIENGPLHQVKVTMRAFLTRRKRLKVPTPPKPSILLESPREAYYQERPPPREDNPLAAIYRIYWAVVTDNVMTMRNEIENFWRQHAWSVSEIPDPKDPEPERYAVVSAIPFLLVAAFNNLINRGLPRDAPGIMTSDELDKVMQRKPKPEMCPTWAKDAPPLTDTLVLPDKEGRVVKGFGEEGVDQFLAQKNILCQGLHIYFV